jgi:ribosome-binding protein aMBF1 (putative translation factor)
MNGSFILVAKRRTVKRFHSWLLVSNNLRYHGRMNASQCRAARALLDWSQEQLAAQSHVSVTTLRNFERGATVPMANNLSAIRAALEAAGVEFIPENGGGPGVRLRKG